MYKYTQKNGQILTPKNQFVEKKTGIVWTFAHGFNGCLYLEKNRYCLDNSNVKIRLTEKEFLKNFKPVEIIKPAKFTISDDLFNFLFN